MRGQSGIDRTDGVIARLNASVGMVLHMRSTGLRMQARKDRPGRKAVLFHGAAPARINAQFRE